ncbi:MAG TPA: AAA family ATPase [Marmoricola sp.]|nr:AAA family ATPase [Marmoricola sp.]
MLLGPEDPLPGPLLRVLVSGSSGAGKSTLARLVAADLGLPYVELDGLYHGPGWTPRIEFLDDVSTLANGERWITEWQYTDARPILLPRCDLLVQLDTPRLTALRRVTRRTLSRRFRRTELWNGNREGPLWHIVHDREHIIRWSWSTHHRAAERIAQVLIERPELPVVRLRPREVAAWLDRLRPGPGTPARPR